MNLYEFATCAEDSELYTYISPEHTTNAQFGMLNGNGAECIILWAKGEDQHLNNMTFDEARMLMIFVALATGEECDD